MIVKGERLAKALLSNLDVWIQDLEELSSMPGPHQRQALHLQRNVLQTKMALHRLLSADIE